ncbi:M20/M25/M40 family metallo-hydrolase [Opitutia bacterium ISCC 51]|nr:M20/M25/M40 family metallo-hydrolase [Opitutae bacterium ISCC 51]QXD26614.1 M20/M25/M40 family metallo-hydrolase [Opitutae bacterium ISCC 52]
MSNSDYQVPDFLRELLASRSPSGNEAEAQVVFDKFMEPKSDLYEKDVLGNRIATLNPEGDPSVLLAGHLDELGFIIKYIDDCGYLFFDTIGGHDRIMISGRRVRIKTKNGIVKGVTGKRAVHLMDTSEREKVPKIHNMWIDLGVANKKEAEALVRVGDTVTYDHEFEMINGSVGSARAFDNKTGAYIAGEVLRRLAEESSLAAKVVSVGTAQEEIGVRGAATSTFAVAPNYGIAIDVSHATDFPDADNKQFGAFKMGGGAIISRGPQLNPLVCESLIDVAEQENIPYQIEAERGLIGNDSRSIQVAGPGVATGAIGIPLRYMHTPSEMVDLEDLEACIQLLVAWIKTLKKGDRGIV